MIKELPRKLFIGFLAGAVGVLLFHQLVLLLAHAVGLVPFAPYSLQPTAPLGVPQVVSTAFWGGIWGIAMVLLMTWIPGAERLWVAVLFGAVLPSLVAAVVVTPLKGGDMAAWMAPGRILLALVINGAWGLGTWLIYRLAWHGFGSTTAGAMGSR
jgi:hypothetical protein